MTALFLLLWVALLLLAMSYVLFVIPHRAHYHSTKEALRTIMNGFRQGLRHCGVNLSKKKCPVELWKWETMKDEDVCEDCLERTSWPPMDIVDWMKEGVPRTPEADTYCSPNCRCELIRYKPDSLLQKLTTKKE